MIYVFLIFFSTLTASALSSVFAQQLVPSVSIFLFKNNAIPSFTAELALEKTLDVLEFPFFLIISIGLFLLFAFLANRKKGYPKGAVIGLSQLIFGIIFYFQTLFVDHSGTQTLILATSAIAFFLLSWLLVKNESINWQKSIFGSGLLLGFYFLILCNIFLPTKIPGISAFFLTPLFFLIFSRNAYPRFAHPAFLLLTLSAFFPFNKPFLLLIGTLVTLLTIVVDPRKIKRVVDIYSRLLIIPLLFIVIYNPLFYFGSFDTIEEGFWLGWLQRILQGEIIYRDFAAYHPPFLLWGLKLFSTLMGASIFTARFYFHLLQVLGTLIIFFTLGTLVKNKWIKIGIFTLILAYGSSLVRNNMEIRLASGLLPLTLISLGNFKKNYFVLFLAGIFSSLSLFISLEVGLATLVSVCFFLITKILSSKEKVYLFGGILFSFILILGRLIVQGSLPGLFNYLTYYSDAFSQGYLNSPLQRPETLTLLQWYKVNQFVGSSGFLWELIKLILGASIAYIIVAVYTKKINRLDFFFAALVLFNLILSRAALARSDGYHISFIWVSTSIILGYLLEKTLSFSRSFSLVIILILCLLIARDQIQVSLIQNQTIKLQTYGNPSGTYPSYSNYRAGIVTGIEIDTKSMDEMISYIQAQVSKKDTIFVFPLAPEIYFLADRKNATQFDTPTAFFTQNYQQQMVSQLEETVPKLVIYNKNFSLSGLTTGSLPIVDNYIQTNFSLDKQFGEYSLLKSN